MINAKSWWNIILYELFCLNITLGLLDFNEYYIKDLILGLIFKVHWINCYLYSNIIFSTRINGIEYIVKYLLS